MYTEIHAYLMKMPQLEQETEVDKSPQYSTCKVHLYMYCIIHLEAIDIKVGFIHTIINCCSMSYTCARLCRAWTALFICRGTHTARATWDISPHSK